jgi:hypothetical protein
MGSLIDAAAARSSRPLALVDAHRSERLWRRIRGLRHCQFITRTPYGEPHPRTLRVQNRSLADGEPLWFFVERGSDLLLDVQTHPEVEIDFALPEGRRLRLHGSASLHGSLDDHLFSFDRVNWRMPATDDGAALHRLLLLRVDIERVEEHAPLPAANEARLGGAAAGLVA